MSRTRSVDEIRSELVAALRTIATATDQELGLVATEADRPRLAAQALHVARGGIRNVVEMLDGATS